MLYITIDSQEYFNDATGEFVTTSPYRLQLEHSLVSISKWEAIYEECFLSSTDIKDEKLRTYIKCMTITQNVPEEVYTYITNDHVKKINDYILKPMTATTFADDSIKGKTKPVRRSEKYTAEVIYYWMIALNIPFECQRWHINRLLTLIKVCNLKNTPEQKKSAKETAMSFREINARNKKRYGTRG